MRRQYLVGLLMLVSFASTHAQNAADAYYDPEEMAKARAALQVGHGSQIASLILAERLEYQYNSQDPLAVWEAQGWIGGDINKLWVKTEGEFDVDQGRFEEAEIQALYSRAISPFWDLQAGVRYDIKPDPTRTYAVIGLQGLARQWFELDNQLFVSDQGNVSLRLEAEYELRITQRLMLQPRLELEVAFSDDEATGIGSGLSSAEAGLRLRYEIRRELAPYIGVSWNHFYGTTDDLRRAEGGARSQLSWVAGIRFWF